MARRAHCSLRTHRRLWGLKQRELALLLGIRSAAHISRLERGKRIPTLEVALACELLFNLPPAELFAPEHQKVEDDLLRRAYALYTCLTTDTSSAASRKRELIEGCLNRAVLNIKKKGV